MTTLCSDSRPRKQPIRILLRPESLFCFDLIGSWSEGVYSGLQGSSPQTVPTDNSWYVSIPLYNVEDYMNECHKKKKDSFLQELISDRNLFFKSLRLFINFSFFGLKKIIFFFFFFSKDPKNKPNNEQKHGSKDQE